MNFAGRPSLAATFAALLVPAFEPTLLVPPLVLRLPEPPLELTLPEPPLVPVPALLVPVPALLVPVPASAPLVPALLVAALLDPANGTEPEPALLLSPPPIAVSPPDAAPLGALEPQLTITPSAEPTARDLEHRIIGPMLLLLTRRGVSFESFGVAAAPAFQRDQCPHRKWDKVSAAARAIDIASFSENFRGSASVDLTAHTRSVRIGVA